MEFDKSRVYTALSADELEKGDIVCASDTLAELRNYVTGGKHIAEIIGVKSPDNQYRFVTDDDTPYLLAYLIAKHDDPYKEFKKAQAAGKTIWFRHDDGKWYRSIKCDFSFPIDYYSLTDLTREYKVFLHDGRFVYTEAEVPDGTHIYYSTTDIEAAFKWCTAHNKFADVAKAWEDGKTIEFRPVTEKKHWAILMSPSWGWGLQYEYRVKPALLKWTDLKIGDSLRKGSTTAMVTGIDTSPQSDMHIHICFGWLRDEDLTEWERA